mgnify:FL=1
MSTTQLECLWNYIDSLNLSLRSRKWLSDKLIEPRTYSEAHKKKQEVLAGRDAGLKEMKAKEGVRFEDFIKEMESVDKLTRYE